MSAATAAALYALSARGIGYAFPFRDDVTPGPASAQGTAKIVSSQVMRVTKSVASGSMIMPSITTGEADAFNVVINDSGQTILVYCALGEAMDGSTNGNRSLATGTVGVFFRVRESETAAGGPDWRSNAIA